MENIPSAVKLLEKYSSSWNGVVLGFIRDNLGYPDPSRVLIGADEAIAMAKEFAKLHVQAALETALEEVPYEGYDSVSYDDLKGILTCYPLDQIK